VQAQTPPAAAAQLFQEASRLQNAGKFAEAAGKWRKFLHDHPADAAAGLAYQGLGACLLETDELAPAIEALRQAQKLLPTGESAASIRWNIAIGLYRQAQKTATKEHRQQAMAAFDELLADNNTTKERRALALYYQAEQAEKAGDWARARRYYDDFLRDFPGHPSGPIARLGLADVLLQDGKHKAAEELFGQLASQPAQAGAEYAHFRWAELTELRDEHGLATQRWSSFLQKHPKSVHRDRALLGLARGAFKLKRLQEAVKYYAELWDAKSPLLQDQATRLDAVTTAFATGDSKRGLDWTDTLVKDAAASLETSQAQLLAARCLIDGGDLDAGWQRCKWVLTAKVADTQPVALQLAGHCAMKLRKFDDAVTYYQTLRDQYPQSDQAPAAAFSLGIAYESQGVLSKALTAYQDFLKRHGDHALAEQARRRVMVLQGKS
jgi:TolA-binding protein